MICLLSFCIGMNLLSNPLTNVWYPIISHQELKRASLHKKTFFDKNYVIYRNPRTDQYIVHSDICPHQGASLSRGKVDKEGHLYCPYHNFEFENGRFCRIPNPCHDPKPFDSNIQIPLFETRLENDFLFVRNSTIPTPSESNSHVETIYFPPEEYNSSFRSIEGSIMISSPFMMVCENLLDMLHISYVHSFGSKVSPLPLKIRSKRLSPSSFQTTFTFIPHPNTISSRVGNVNYVTVENEYHLATNTITRVYAGPIVKTVFTRSIPISSSKTLLYWKIYRNFWINDWLEPLSVIGDWIVYLLMQRTIQEDINILQHVDPHHREGPLRVKYDKTIQQFRKDYQSFLDL